MSNTGRAVVLILCVSCAFIIKAEKIHNISEFLTNVIKTYETSKPPNDSHFKKASILKALRKSSKQSDIEDTIRAKIAELAPLLDDKKIDGEEQHNKRKTGDIKEELFLESSNLKPAKLKYKKMRKEIENLMKLEPITDETKRVVTEALDQIENELNVNDCYLKKIGGDLMRRGNLRGREPSIVIPKDIERTEIVMKHIKEKWDKVVNQYSMPDVDKTRNETLRKIAFVFLTRLREFVFETHEDYKKLHNRYEMLCFDGKVNRIESELPVFRPDNNKTLFKNETDDCDDIKICSEELLDFLTDFYDQLNVTYSEVFQNYIVMYLKEIDADTNEKQSFTEVLRSIEDHVRMKIKKMFAAEMKTLNEVFNVPSLRIDALRHLIDRIIHNTRELIYASLSLKLRTLKPLLRLTVKQDIEIATSIDLGNLKKEFKDNICSVFRHCNGDGKFRKQNRRYFYDDDPNSIQIRLKLGFGDDPMKLLKPYLKNIKARSSGYILNRAEINDLSESSARKSNATFDFSKFKGVNVTRTTYAGYDEKGTTTSTNNSFKYDANVTTIMESSLSY